MAMSRPMREEKKLSDTRRGPPLDGRGGGQLDRLREVARFRHPPSEAAEHHRPGKKMPISRWADSGPSEPWTRFSVIKIP